MMNGAAPGEPGNLLLAGHRTSWFLPLQNLRVGDLVVVESVQEGASWGRHRAVPHQTVRRQTYRVQEIRVVQPEDVSFLEPTPGSALTLVTCWPFGRRPTSPRRFVVRALPVP